MPNDAFYKVYFQFLSNSSYFEYLNLTGESNETNRAGSKYLLGWSG